MNFKRSEQQTFWEKALGCNLPQNFHSYNKQLENKQILSCHQEQLEPALVSDANSFYFNATLSLLLGLKAIKNQSFSWAAVKLYYATYYYLRASLAIHKIGIIRCGGKQYHYQLQDTPTSISKFSKSLAQIHDRDLSSSHKGTINLFHHYFHAKDPLLRNDINYQDEGEMCVYLWLLKIREQVNYRQVMFSEPDCPIFMQPIYDAFSKNKLENFIQLYIFEDTDMIYPFQEEYAIFAIPIQRALHTCQHMKQKLSFSKAQLSVLTNIFNELFVSTNQLRALIKT